MALERMIESPFSRSYRLATDVVVRRACHEIDARPRGDKNQRSKAVHSPKDAVMRLVRRYRGWDEGKKEYAEAVRRSIPR